MEIYYIVTFESTHLAIKMERLLKMSLKITMLPTPREINASCGLAIQISSADFSEAFNILVEQGVEGMDLFRVEKPKQGARTYTALEWRTVYANGHTNG